MSNSQIKLKFPDHDVATLPGNHEHAARTILSACAGSVIQFMIADCGHLLPSPGSSPLVVPSNRASGSSNLLFHLLDGSLSAYSVVNADSSLSPGRTPGDFPTAHHSHPPHNSHSSHPHPCTSAPSAVSRYFIDRAGCFGFISGNKEL